MKDGVGPVLLVVHVITTKGKGVPCVHW